MSNNDRFDDESLLDGIDTEFDIPEDSPEDEELTAEDEAIDQIYIGAIEEKYGTEVADAVENMTEEDWAIVERDNPEFVTDLVQYLDDVDKFIQGEND